MLETSPGVLRVFDWLNPGAAEATSSDARPTDRVCRRGCAADRRDPRSLELSPLWDETEQLDLGSPRLEQLSGEKDQGRCDALNRGR
jgi:hypothetical protein